MTGGAKRVELNIPASPDFIVVARLTTAAVANRLNYTADEIEDLKLAVAEACTTCIGNETSGAAISIVWDVHDGMLDVRVGDQCGEHDGLGLTIVRQLMDRVWYVHENGVTTLCMSKRLVTS